MLEATLATVNTGKSTNYALDNVAHIYLAHTLSNKRNEMLHTTFGKVAAAYHVRFRGRVGETEGFDDPLRAFDVISRNVSLKNIALYRERNKKRAVPGYLEGVAAQHLKATYTDFIQDFDCADNINDIYATVLLHTYEQMRIRTESYQETRPEARFLEAMKEYHQDKSLIHAVEKSPNMDKWLQESPSPQRVQQAKTMLNATNNCSFEKVRTLNAQCQQYITYANEYKDINSPNFIIVSIDEQRKRYETDVVTPKKKNRLKTLARNAKKQYIVKNSHTIEKLVQEIGISQEDASLFYEHSRQYLVQEKMKMRACILASYIPFHCVQYKVAKKIKACKKTTKVLSALLNCIQSNIIPSDA